MPTLKEYNNLKELRRAIVQKQVDTESLLDWESDRKLSKWLEEKGETDKARQLVGKYDINSENPTLILEVLSFSKEEIKKIIAGKNIDNSSHNTENITLEELNREVALLKKQINGLNELKMPVGTISLFSIENIPNGWLRCKGQCLSISCFESLFGQLGHTWGNNGKDNFFLPNLQQQACNSKLCYCIFTGEYKIPKEAIKQTSLLFTIDGASFEMVFVEGGTFMIGTSEVTLSSYYIGQFQVTQELWKAVMRKNPSYYEGDTLPVETVSHNDCIAFIEKLNKLTGERFRLLTEAEWEYAARGGKYTKGFTYSGSNVLSEVAWNRNCKKPHPVGKKKPNELGVYDMSGNVWEWCQDWYDSNYPSSKQDPTGPSTGSNRVNRGSSHYGNASSCAVTHRSCNLPGDIYRDLGLRLALVPQLS